MLTIEVTPLYIGLGLALFATPFGYMFYLRTVRQGERKVLEGENELLKCLNKLLEEKNGRLERWTKILKVKNGRLKNSNRVLKEKVSTLEEWVSKFEDRVQAGEALIDALKKEFGLQKGRADAEFELRVVEEGKRYQFEFAARKLTALVENLGELLQKVTKDLAEAKSKAERAKLYEAFFTFAKAAMAVG